MQPEPIPERDALRVSTVLVRDDEHFRDMLLMRIARMAEALARMAPSATTGQGRVACTRRVKEYIDDINASAELLGQIGWTPPRKGGKR